MATGKGGARATGAGRDGLKTVRPAPTRQRQNEKQGTASMTDQRVREWEAAYRKYGHASEVVARSSEDDPVAAWEMATASWDVAVAWRSIAATGRLPWWTLAAIESAAEAFEAQARDWEAREQGSDDREGAPEQEGQS
jgi:hypothetical protein